LVAYGLDVTLKCTMEAEACLERFQGGPFEVVREMAEVWFRRTDRITFHDPLAATCIFEPDICTYRTGRVAVDLERGEKFGETSFEEAAEGPHRIADGVDPDRFFRRYFEVTGAFRP
jgi:purine nucleosidase